MPHLRRGPPGSSRGFTTKREARWRRFSLGRLTKRRRDSPLRICGDGEEVLYAQPASFEIEEEESFLSAQADGFAGAKAEKKSACFVRNDGGW